MQGAIVGCGYISTLVHIPTLYKNKDVDLVAVCDINKKLALHIAKKYHINKVYLNLLEMLEKEKLDLVSICTPPVTHSRFSNLAMDYGVHVLVEKPMALNSIEAKKMLMTAEKNKVRLCVMHNFMFDSEIQRAKHIIEKGEIGEIVDVETKVYGKLLGDNINPEHWMHKLPGGFIGEFAPHAIYLQQAFLKNILLEYSVATKTSNLSWIPFDEIKVLLKTEKATGSITLYLNSPIVALTVDIVGTKKIIHCNVFNKTFKMIKKDSNLKIAFNNLGKIWRKLGSLPGFQYIPFVYSTSSRTIDQVSYTRGHRILINKFVESIKNDTEVPVKGEEGLKMVEMLEKILKDVGLN
jgi:predicted dehydrogenase